MDVCWSNYKNLFTSNKIKIYSEEEAKELKNFAKDK